MTWWLSLEATAFGSRSFRESTQPMRRKLFAALVGACFLIASSLPAGAHGGGLNKDGCHNETATGGYHCHRGGEGDTKTLLIVVGALVGLVVVGIGLRKIGESSVFHFKEHSPEGPRLVPTQGDHLGVFLELKF